MFGGEVWKIALTLVSGVCWTWAYVEMIRVGFRHRSYAMPLFALALNFAWEVVYAAVALPHVHGLTDSLSVQAVVNLVWALLDVAIIVTFVKFAAEQDEWAGTARRTIWAAVGVAVATAFAMQLSFADEFGIKAGATYGAFLQNVVMSVLFITMLFRRRSRRGQRIRIAVLKLVGTAAATLLFGVAVPNTLALRLGIIAVLFDCVYLVMLHRSPVWTAATPGPAEPVQRKPIEVQR